jgi:cell division protein FtsI (penicillin-binding protein 3)
MYIQDAHHALLKQLQDYEADHGCVVVMETKRSRKSNFQFRQGADGTYMKPPITQ